MVENKLSQSLVVAFFIVMIAYFAVWFFATSQVVDEAVNLKQDLTNNFTPRTEYIVVEGEKTVHNSNKVIINDKYVGKIDKDGSIVAVSKSGQAYNVANGVVLADDMVISANDESYSVYRVNDPEKSVTSK